ncbi:hypothetical protein [Flavobacterium granuli]|uniref:TerB family tellurite resistance protein n=1 Tax=Flavobacterium granuli TaxID=280093 RepID=A0ABU1S3H3_9FLAO|nr:hypothetical protein [Flavobacterium granuli]MDR6845571.1 hypothetical protein [Flavobacterium granuli]
MKRIIVLLFIANLLTGELQAQGKQQKMLLLQIAALKVYIEYGQRGYAVVKKGLNFIGDVKKGEVNLHADYFTSLKKVNPEIKNYVRVGEIIALQIKIFKTYKKTLKELQNDDLFHGDELDYIERSFDRLLENCNTTLNELLEVTTDAKLEMKDDQRLEHIDTLYKTMMDDYSFCQSFCKDVRILSLSRTKEINDVKSAHALHGL